MTNSRYNVLFLCTGNSARSIIAESILQQDGEDRFRAFSAGSKPRGQVNPFALQALEAAGYATNGLRSKSWEAFAIPGAPAIDLVITVCDNAAAETCPIWPGYPMTAHWGMEDPATFQGTDAEKHAAFLRALRCIRGRIGRLIALPVTELDAGELRSRLRAIGQEDGAPREVAQTTAESAAGGNKKAGQ
ncbi:MAG: arsenate reductase ArsC [Woeseiaceae bacterium]